ncbi:molybdenum cofactor sulfurase [Jannaschia sp. AI_61]|nr:molybdenum cofactor sulfurase [Jannaschia sp. AI_61]
MGDNGVSDTTHIAGLYLGQVQNLWPGKAPSAIAKVAAPGRVAVGATGLVGDAQADLRVHGGTGKAIHVYPAVHYPRWIEDLGPNARFTPSGFGENISLPDWTETEVSIGDVWRLGTATVAVSQGRQPCWKLSAHVGEDTMAYRVRKTRRTGWYLRVIEGGSVAVGDAVTVLERPHPEWTVNRVARALFDPKQAGDDEAALAHLAALDPSWRGVFAERHARKEAEV